ncbi:MAG: RNA polymerase sigma factor [Bacteroidales bacterium]|nr:RNA polymerase sigma factor [Bacteroidales bacterium]
MLHNQLRDQALLEMIGNPDTARLGFRQLVEEYQQKLYAHIFRITGNHDDTDDALQETFIKAWKKLGTFRKESPIYSWLLSIANNEALSCLRKRKMRNIMTLNLINYQSNTSSVQMPASGSSEIEKQFEKALETLAAKQRIIFGMRYFDELPYAEIARILNKSAGTVKSTYHQAHLKISQYLKNHGE